MTELYLKATSRNSWLVRGVDFLVTFILVHYFLWIFGAAFVSYIVWKQVIPWGKYAVLVLLTVYMPYYLVPYHKGLGNPWPWLRKCKFWHSVKRYSKCSLLRETELDPSKQYVFGVHPHGILVINRIILYGGWWEEIFPKIDMRTLAATPIFMVPFAREFSLFMGAVDASRKTAEKVLNSGLSLAVYPGGTREIFDTDPNSMETTLYLKKRKGFIRLALSRGASLVPSYVYGEKYAYRRLDIPKHIWKVWYRFTKLPLIVFWGRFFTWMPYVDRAPMLQVFGKPIQVPKIDNPTEEEVDNYHALYIDALKALFDKYKKLAGYDDEEALVIA